VRKPYAPGAHGNSGNRGRGLSEYGKQLMQKQKIRRMYGISERQFRRHLEEAKRRQGVIGDNLIAILEMRLDNVIYRLGLADSRSQARQIVGHGHLQVNGKNLDVASASVKIGDSISIKDTKKEKNYFKDMQAILKKKEDSPSWLDFNSSKMEGKIISKPTKDEIGVRLDIQGVIDFYSR
jgi:small subunit ribosomal protein S4